MKIVIIGGGAAGFFSAIQLAENHPAAQVTILERGRSVLEKVRISGGGRCNVTHACWDPRELTKFYPRGERELLGPFNKFACGDTMGWFEDRGVELKIEEDGRVFPVSDDSGTIIDCLWNTAKQNGVKVITRCRAEKFWRAENGQWQILANGETFAADRLVVTTGSNPAIWKQLKALGLEVIDPLPSLFAFNVPDKKLHALSGISLPWAQLRIEGNKLKAEGPLLITHKGLSGPAVLRISAWGARELAPMKYNFKLRVNWLARRQQDVDDDLRDLAVNVAKQQIGSHGQFDLPQRLWRYFLDRAGIKPETRWAELGKKPRLKLTEQLTNGSFQVNGKATNKDEFTTAGGVALREIDFKNFTCKKIPGLHLAGEVLDIDAITGGFNFQAAWTGGYLIGGR
ncbi:aminoacetone oxidase family FAD-binding enzyme [Lewinellaceae bacterium SD302]|nr:aminoacetone oxidase family FAD-binding enzyme [Lewinellaceae bacterium SD302]